MFEEPESTLDDTNPRPPTDLDERLRREEPPIDADDTSPSKRLSLDEKLAQEEPPLAEDDTNPSKRVALEARLRAEEPPVVEEDTNPSLITRQKWLTGDLVPPRQGRDRWRFQRATAGLMLAGALALTLAAGILLMDNEDGGTSNGPNLAGFAGDASQPDSASPTAQPTQITQETADNESSASPAAPTLTPPATAAADEIAVALLTPAPVIPPVDAIARHNNPFTILPAKTRYSVVQYTVQQGDTLETIAARFGLNDFYTLIWSNQRSKYSPLRPGTQINILPEDGVYYEVAENITIGQLAEKYNIDPYTIIDSEYNNTGEYSLFGSTPDTLLVKGMWIVIPGAEGERVNILPANTGTSSGGGGGSISGSYTLWGCTSNISGGSAPVNRPIQGGYAFMQGFSLGGHEAVDLSPRSGIGEPVHAAGGGTVAYAGWSNYGYGNVVVIAHGSSFSLYGHLDRYSVSCGGSVSAGDVIGTVGNTGNSSGPHLHFEIRDADWHALNPQSSIGF